MLELKVPATSANLGPGFDCLGLALQVYNRFTFEKSKEGLEVNVYNNNEEEIEIGLEDNLIYQAIKRFEKRTGLDVNNIKITERSKVPLARGMGSSATAIVATLYGLNKIYDQPLKEKQLIDIAVSLEGHSDNVVPAYIGGFVINTLNNKDLNYKKISVIDSNLKLVMVIPNFELQTSELRSVLPDKIDYQDAIFNQSRTALLTSIFASKDWNQLKVAIKDRLHQDYRAKLIPGFNSVIESGYKAGALGVALSGAGPTVIAFAQGDSQHIAKRMVETFAANGVQSSYIITKINNHGIKEL